MAGDRPAGRELAARLAYYIPCCFLMRSRVSGGHRPPLLVDSERDLLEVLLAAPLAVPGAEDLRAVPAATETIADHLDLALLGLETAEVGPDVLFAVQLAPQYDDPSARSVAGQDLVDGIGEVPMRPRWLSSYWFFVLILRIHAAGQFR